MPQLFTDAMILPVAAAVVFPVVVALGVYVLRRILIGRDPDIDER
jgi:hypothetical protein